MTKIRKLHEFPGYGVSRDGRVWTKHRKGRGGVSDSWKPLQAWSGGLNRAYDRVNMKTTAGVYKKFYVHRLVYVAFIREILPGEEVNHKDGDPKNNRVENLEAVSHAKNMKHAAETGLVASYQTGTWSRKLTALQIRAIQALKRAGFSIQEMSGLLHIHFTTIARRAASEMP